MFDLKTFREKSLKMTPGEFAELIGVSEEYILRIEQQSDEIPLKILERIASATGIKINELINYQGPDNKPFSVENTWKNTEITKRNIVDYIEENINKNLGTISDNYKKYIDDLRMKVQQILSKPKVVIVGHSDVGKSTLINYLLDAEKMPTDWTPTTSIIVYIKHINDRPEFIKDECWIFRASLGNEKSWDERKLYDEEYCKKWKIAGGNAEILKEYGTRQSEMFGKNEAGAAVVFVDSKILTNCDLIDLPGFGTGDRIEDDLMAISAMDIADVLIYMSIANSFLRESDIEYLKEAINSLKAIENKKINDFKPLANLFIVASQSHTVDYGNPKSLTKILDNGCKRFLNTLSDTFWENRQELTGYEYNYNVLRSRFFTFSMDIPRRKIFRKTITRCAKHLRVEFENELKGLIEKLPMIIDSTAKEFIKKYIADIGISIDREINKFNGIITERNKYEKLLAEILENEPLRANENANRRIEIVSEIRKLSEESTKKFIEKYNSIIDVNNIINVIKRKKFRKKKEDIQNLLSYINSELKSALENILKEHSLKLKEKIDKYLSDFENSIKLKFDVAEINEVNISFDSKVVFASGLVGLATFGGLAAWAASLGNLGAYILVAKGVSLLSALGISISGGTAAAVAAVSSIGGPVVLGIVIAVLAALSVFAILSGGWEKKVAEKIVNEYNSREFLEKYKEIIKQFWVDTEKAFNKGADYLEDEWKKYVENLKEMVNSYDIGEIQMKINEAERFKNFLSGIPL